MLAFTTLHTKFLDTTSTIDITNLESNADHWRSAFYIHKFVEELELTLFKFNTFFAAERELIDLLLKLNKDNPRIEEIIFFTDVKNSVLVCMCVSDIATFKPHNFLKRNITIDLHKQTKKLLFTDITKPEWRQINDPTSATSIPEYWQINMPLTNRYNKLKNLFL